MDIRKDLLVNAWYTGGVNVIDFTNPEKLREIAWYDITASARLARTTGPPTPMSGLASARTEFPSTHRTGFTSADRPWLRGLSGQRASAQDDARPPQPTNDGLVSPTLQACGRAALVAALPFFRACCPGDRRGRAGHPERKTGGAPLERRARALPGRRRSRRATSSTTTRGRARAHPAPARPAVHDEALPRGIAGGSFFQKQAPKGMPDWIPTRRFRTWPREGETRLVDFPLVNAPRRCSGWCRCTAST